MSHQRFSQELRCTRNPRHSWRHRAAVGEKLRAITDSRGSGLYLLRVAGYQRCQREALRHAALIMAGGTDMLSCPD